MTNTVKSLAELFDEVFTIPVKAEKTEVIHSKKLSFDPLAYIISCRSEPHFPVNRKFYNKSFYEKLNSVLAGTDTVDPATISDAAIVHAQEIRKHFRNKILMVALRGHHVSDFRTALQEILEQDVETKSSHLPILIRLPDYYQEDMFMQNLIDNYNSVEYPQLGYADFDDNVSFVGKYTRYGRRNNFTKFYFSDSKNCLVSFKLNEDYSMFDPFVNYFAQPGKSFGIRGTLPVSTDTGYPHHFYQLVGKGSYEFY